MNSIKKKLFIQIGSLIIILVSLIFLANTLLYESYYTSNQKDRLIDYYNTINSLKSSDYDKSLLKFVLIENKSNIDILITNTAGNILYTSNGYLAKQDNLNEPSKQNSFGNEKPKPSKPPVEITKSEKINNNVSFFWAKDPHLKNQHLMLIGTLDNNNLIELRLPIASIKDNIRLSNNFILIIGLIVFFLSMIFAFIISNNFTKPIREMNDATKRMKNLDFSTSCNIISNDEIGQLGESINKMAIELSNTINSLNDKNEQLENEIKEKIRLDEKRRNLLNNVSHELKTPLSLMQGYAEGLKLNIAKNKEKSDFYCDVIVDESLKMNRIVENLLNINQIEFGDVSLNKTNFEINELILNSLKKYSKVFEDKKINIKVNITEAIEVYADPFMIEMILNNYITNAINYVDEKLSIEICSKKLLNSIRIEVFNTSYPIDEKEAEKIWDRFYKLDKARTREKGGHGLGLSIVKAIQDAHNSSYGLKNVNDGVCFWFDIDIA